MYRSEGGGGGHTVEGVPAVARAHGLAHGDAGGLHVLAEELDVLVLVGMDAAGVAAPDEVGQFDEDAVGVLEILGLVDGEDREIFSSWELVAEGLVPWPSTRKDVRASGMLTRAVRDDLRRLGDDCRG